MNVSEKLRYRVNDRIYLTLLAVLLMVFTLNCSGDSPSDEPEEMLTEKEAVETLIDIIRDSGIPFPILEDQSVENQEGRFPKIAEAEDFNLSGSDYLTSSFGEGVILINLWLGPNGHIIPKPSWQSAHPDVCLDQGRYMNAAVQMAEFKITPSLNFIQVNLIEIETGIIQESIISEQGLSDPDWLDNGLTEVWSKLKQKASIKGVTGPCGQYKNLMFYFDSKTTMQTEGGSSFDHVRAEFKLSFDEEKNTYSGSGILEFIDHSSTFSNSCMPVDAEMGILSLSPSVVEESGSNNIEIVLFFNNFVLDKPCQLPQFPFSFPILHLDNVILTTAPIHYEFTNMERKPGDVNILAEINFIQSVTSEDQTHSEETLIEIRRE